MNENSVDPAAEKATLLAKVSFIFGSVIPGGVILAFLLLIFVLTGLGGSEGAGFGALGISAVFSLGLPVLTVFFGIPIGIIALIFAILALRAAKKASLPIKRYILVIFYSFLTFVIPAIVVIVIFPFKATCMFNEQLRYSNTGCLRVPFIPQSWQSIPAPGSKPQLPPDAKTTFNNGFSSVQLTQTYKDDINNFSFYYPSNYSLTKNVSGTNSETVTLSDGTSTVTLFVNAPYPQNATATVQGIMNGHFENGRLQTDGGYGFDSTQQNLYRGHEITDLSTDSNGYTYYWKFYVVGDEEDEAALDIIYSLKVF
jgi:hypothetical protein